MKKILTVAALIVLGWMASTAQITIDNKAYDVDTIIHRQVGPGVVNTIVRLPGYTLNV